MVNANVVKAAPLCFLRALFCDIFRVLGRFLHFKKPVKYDSNSRINLETVHFPRGPRHDVQLLCRIFNDLIGN